jgi:formate hydrogenlyase transcriptional activator
LVLDNALAHARVRELEARLARESGYFQEEIKAERDLRLLTGESAAMKAVRQAIQQVAQTDSTALIIGETGTGKELVARAIHQLSPRRDHLLVKVNCAALAPSVITSELFGHEPGAFTGAFKRRIGRFELARKGTIFLDEIGEVPAEIQVLLLRVLQERVIERVGGNESIAVDVRVVAATHQDLDSLVSQGKFRADLFYRLNVFPIAIPPLRERREDIPSLVSHFVQHFGRRLNKQVILGASSLEQLVHYHWPGNVRELENVIERAMILASGESLEIDPTWFNTVPIHQGHATLADTEREKILEALNKSRGKIYGATGAAAALGLKPTTLYGKMRKHGITTSRPTGASS